MEPTGRLVLLCHAGSWDRLYQAASAAAAAASLGRAVDLVFFFGALDRLVREDLDEVRLEPADPERESRLRDRVEEVGTQPVSALLAAARTSPNTRIYACSASSALMDLDLDRVAEQVDEIIGWPTVIRLMDGAGQVLYL